MKPHCYEIGGGWGDAITWMRPEQHQRDNDVNTRFDVSGHKWRIPEVGDLLTGDFAKSTRLFKFVEVRRCGDPPDMFFGAVVCIEVRPKSKGGSLCPRHASARQPLLT